LVTLFGILPCCGADYHYRYLYESEYYEKAQHLVDMALSIIADKNGLVYGRAMNLLGLIYLDINRPRKALDSFLTGLGIREKLLNSEDGFVASSLSNVGLAYTELGDFEKSIEYQQKAIDIRLKTNSNMIGNSYSNMASCLLRMGKVDDAEEMLMRCPSLKNMTDESFLRSDNLRFTRLVLIFGIQASTTDVT
jgi:tetratricopeptide (TPR) repeat protein